MILTVNYRIGSKISSEEYEPRRWVDVWNVLDNSYGWVSFILLGTSKTPLPTCETGES